MKALPHLPWVRIAAIGSVVSSAFAFALNCLPNGSVADKLLYVGLFIRLFAADLVLLLWFGLLASLAYLVMPPWLDMQRDQRRRPSREARPKSAALYIAASVLAVATVAVVVPATLDLGRYTFVYLREDLLASHLRRAVLLEARAAEAGGDLETAVEKLHRFARMFPDRAEANDIDSEVKRLQSAMTHSMDLSERADRIEASTGILQSVVELRIVSLAAWPGRPDLRAKLEQSMAHWREALESQRSFRATCEANRAQEARQVALTLVALGYRHPEDLPGAHSLQDAGPALCRLVRGLPDDGESKAWLLTNAQSLLDNSTAQSLERRALQVRQDAWVHDPDRYYSSRMQAVLKGVWYFAVWGRPGDASTDDPAEERESDVASDDYDYAESLFPVAMLEPAPPTRNQDEPAPAEGREGAFKVVAAPQGDLLLCWSTKSRLPDIALAGPNGSPEVSISRQCRAAEREFSPLSLRSPETRELLGQLISRAVARVVERPSDFERPIRRSMCFMIAELGASGVLPSTDAADACHLEILLQRLRRKRSS